MTAPLPLLMDCDTGVDDALALLYLAATPGVDLRGVTTVAGNTSAEQAAINTLQVLELAGRTDIPVAAGAATPLTGTDPEYATHVHGDNGIGNIQLPPPTADLDRRDAVQLIIDAAHEAPGALHILATAPLTNLAHALEREPRLPELVGHVTVMGGAVHHPGNIGARAEANIGNDPEAAARVLAAGWELTIVPLDVTMRERLTPAHQDRLRAHGTPAARFAADALDVYFDFHERIVFPFRASACHDPLAAAMAAGDLTPVQAPVLHVTVDTTQGPARGELVADARGMYRDYPRTPEANARVLLETDGTFPERLVERINSIAVPTADVPATDVPAGAVPVADAPAGGAPVGAAQPAAGSGALS
ncbi:nucleoside hydrolase [Streptomyces sp. NBC_00483]|uniref:nucleoside hydrolase n=1 Tax=Streptomyces sp. NBC_00483 TaxID=2975756 RepID=UPI002E19E18B